MIKRLDRKRRVLSAIDTRYSMEISQRNEELHELLRKKRLFMSEITRCRSAIVSIQESVRKSSTNGAQLSADILLSSQEYLGVIASELKELESSLASTEQEVLAVEKVLLEFQLKQRKVADADQRVLQEKHSLLEANEIRTIEDMFTARQVGG